MLEHLTWKIIMPLIAEIITDRTREKALFSIFSVSKPIMKTVVSSKKCIYFNSDKDSPPFPTEKVK